MALAGLAAVGLVALNYETRLYDWPDGPVYVAEAAPLSPSECRGWQSRAARRHMAGFPGSWEAYEGFSRLQGACHPQDQDRGRALIEASIAKGAGRYLMVEYVMALRVAGDTVRANAEFPLAAEVMRARIEIHIARVPSSWRPIVVEAKAEIARIETLRDWAALQARVDHILSRPAMLPQAESNLLWRTLNRMDAVDFPEASFQRDRAWRTGRLRSTLGEAHLRGAAGCGHPEAIRLYARLVLDEDRNQGEAGSVMRYLAWLDSKTGAEAALLAEFAARYPWGRVDREREFPARERWIADRCQPRPDESISRNRQTPRRIF